MGVVKFKDFGEIANAGLGDGIDGAVQRAMESLPPDTFYWVNGDNPTAIAPYATYDRGRIVIDVLDDIHIVGGTPAIGVKPPEGSIPVKLSHDSTTFEYQGRIFEVMHKSQPFYRA